jgi:hypothetical protein
MRRTYLLAMSYSVKPRINQGRQPAVQAKICCDVWHQKLANETGVDVI